MKFFTLIHKDEIHLASGDKKIIPSDEFSTLLEGKELLKKVEEDIALYRKEVEGECEKLKEEARKAGFKEGLGQWTKKLAECEKALSQTKAEVEKMIVPVAIQAAKKVVGKEMKLHPETIVDIVKQSLKSVSQHRRFSIYVNKQDLAILEENKAKLKEGLESVETLGISVREGIQQGDAVIETEGGIINVEQELLWKSLESAFTKLMK